MTTKEKERIERLQRRANFLQSRIAKEPKGKLSYDDAEYSALQWAINKLIYLLK